MGKLKERKTLTEMTQIVSGVNPRTGKAPTREQLQKAREWIADYEERRGN